MGFEYFTDPHLRKILDDSSHARPFAVHVEAQSHAWLDENPTHHGKLCAHILSGGRASDTGLADMKPFLTPELMNLMGHQAVRLVSISTCYPANEDQLNVDEQKINWPVILRAVGNQGNNWQKRRKQDCFTGLHTTPAYVRVGESADPRKVIQDSQASGPAFVCSHPFHLDRHFGYALHPTQDEINRFQDHARVAGYGCSPMNQAWSAGVQKYGKTGTSYSAPHAGAMIMRHTAGMTGLSSYDILPAVFLAAQDGRVAQSGDIRNGAGFLFDPARTGLGFLDDAALWLRLKQLEDIHGEGRLSQPHTLIVNGKDRFCTPAPGPVVNTALVIRFNAASEDDVPDHIRLRSPAGTEMTLPLLLKKEKAEKGSGFLTAGFQTAAFFGEKIDRGEWAVECPFRIWRKYKIESAKLYAHCLRADSTGAEVIRRFR